ncbi:MAG TPA: protein norD, partial [Hellea balneolensis]|nr:protein norD [Hellea balneolensis]
MGKFTDIFEPEEFVGGLWHRLVADIGKETHYPDAAIPLEQISRRLSIFYRSLGGSHGVDIKPITAQTSNYRQPFLARITHGSSAITQARFNGDTLFLPETLDIFPTAQANTDLYKWLTIWAAHIGVNVPPSTGDALQD